MRLNLMRAGELLKSLEEENDKLHEMVKVENGHIVLDNHYAIALDRIDTKEKILSWVVHLSDKIWVTGPMIGRLVELACRYNALGDARIPV